MPRPRRLSRGGAAWDAFLAGERQTAWPQANIRHCGQVPRPIRAVVGPTSPVWSRIGDGCLSFWSGSGASRRAVTPDRSPMPAPQPLRVVATNPTIEADPVRRFASYFDGLDQGVIAIDRRGRVVLATAPPAPSSRASASPRPPALPGGTCCASWRRSPAPACATASRCCAAPARRKARRPSRR